jgi:SSS family solute:Na+ symporter
MAKGYFWAVFIFYALCMIVLGVVIHRKYLGHSSKKGLFEFWMAKREMPGLWLGISITAGWLMLGWIGFGMSQIYMYGATGLWILPIPWFLLCFIIIAIVPLVRRLPSVSVPQAIENRFGAPARMLVALFSVFVFLSWAQAELFMAGRLLSPFLGVPSWVCMSLLVLPILIYVYLGGFRAVVTTDVFQFCFTSVFMIVLGVTAVWGASKVSGGDIIGALKQAAPPLSGKGQTFNLWFLGGLFPVVLLIGYLPGWMTEQDLILRLQAAKSTRDARRGACLGLLLITTFIIVLPALVAFCALVVFPPANGAAAAAVDDKGYSIISAFISRMPLGLAVFMVLGIISSQMSTVDTFTNVAAMPLAYDLVDRFLKKRRASEKVRLNAARITTSLVIVAALPLAFMSESLGDIYYISSGVLSASIALPLFFIFWKRTTLAGVMSASLAGFIGTVGGFYYEYKYLGGDEKSAHYYLKELPQWLQGSYGYNYLALGVGLSLVTMVGVSLATRKSAAGQLASVRPQPVDDPAQFEKACALATESAALPGMADSGRVLP